MKANKQIQELVIQSLEHELGGVKIYTTAIECALNPDLKKEWEHYLEETRTHVTALQSVCEAMGLDAAEETPGRAIVRQNGAALVNAMTMALTAGDASAAELVACECVVLAETKDHLNWQLLGKCAEGLPRAAAEALTKAYDVIENQEDEHLYHSKGWCRELWIQSLGLRAVLPPLEERQKVKTAMGAARAEQLSEKAR
jgi:hypothetical protein